MRKLIALFLLFFLFLSLANEVCAQEKVTIYFFWSKTCTFCVKEKLFLEKLVQKNPQLKLKSYEVSQSESIKLLQEAGEFLKADTRWVPFTVIGNQYFSGYSGDESTGKLIEKTIEQALRDSCPDIFESLKTTPTPCPQPSQRFLPSLPETINLPLLGQIKTRGISLPLLTVVIGILDGFNPCAMWTLLFLISLLLGMKERKRMWILGIAFIGTSTFVYFLFMSAWLNLFLFLGFVIWVRVIIGLVALSAGGYNLRQYFVDKKAACKVTGGQRRQVVFEKIRTITQKREFILALVGIILLAFAVNLVELVCSAGLPAVYTQVLTLSRLPTWQYYFYLLLYLFFFMLDDLFVFFAAMITLQMTGVDTKYARFSHLVGGATMLLIGLAMLFKPELLMSEGVF